MNTSRFVRLTLGERAGWLTRGEFAHLRDCGPHGFQMDTKTCAICKEILDKLPFSDDHTEAPE